MLDYPTGVTGLNLVSERGCEVDHRVLTHLKQIKSSAQLSCKIIDTFNFVTGLSLRD